LAPMLTPTELPPEMRLRAALQVLNLGAMLWAVAESMDER
jgi:hypothetical protein